MYAAYLDLLPLSRFHEPHSIWVIMILFVPLKFGFAETYAMVRPYSAILVLANLPQVVMLKMLT